MTIAQHYADLIAELPPATGAAIVADILDKAHAAGAAGVPLADHLAAVAAEADADAGPMLPDLIEAPSEG